jgi:hypothetical protein
MFSGYPFPLSVTIWVTSLGLDCEVATFAELLFYPNISAVPKWFSSPFPQRNRWLRA